MQPGRWPSGGRRLSPDRSSGWEWGYHLVGAFEPHDVDGVGSDADEDEAHGVEVEGAPVVFQEHVRVPLDKHDEINLLRIVGNSDDVFVC